MWMMIQLILDSTNEVMFRDNTPNGVCGKLLQWLFSQSVSYITRTERIFITSEA
jgi:hypothetical protein